VALRRLAVEFGEFVRSAESPTEWASVASVLRPSQLQASKLVLEL
jgi:hypothetical protein